MKKYFSLAFLLAGIATYNAQDVSDALQYSLTNVNGTARFRGMSGAFGAVGGDLSAISINPASSSVFNNNQISGSLNYFGLTNKSNYFGSSRTETANDFNINQLGGVFVFKNNNSDEWTKFAFAINYNNLNNFENRSFSAGINPNSSVVDYFVESANGIRLEYLDDLSLSIYDFDYFGQHALMAYSTYLINPVTTDAGNIDYTSNAIGTGNFYQEKDIISTGYNGKLTFNASALYQDKLYIGLNLNSHFSNYLKSYSIYEDYADATNSDNTAGVQALRFDNDLETNGTGFSFQLGAIFKITEEFRIGGTYESPTWIRLTDIKSHYLTTDCADCPDPGYEFGTDTSIEYLPYTLRTPEKLTGSAAFVFGKEGLISIDYSYKNYKNTTYISDESYFDGLNNDLKDQLKKVNELRIGAEKKYKQWSFRAGYHTETSPYKDENKMGDLTGYSGGIGYNFGGTKLDFAYTSYKRKYGEQFLPYGMTSASQINSKNNNITATLTFEL
ncbi:OmpP1/FadL family transporter [Flavobacterium sp. H122]|uniref:OmpP1/FadL family transporter n=1 Tax=Flavobacterium sp. H122 TaxID=2529860 RepID=UPI0010AA6719|nr:outer membrane protein transport protein [Flavobacterium sp. H122]